MSLVERYKNLSLASKILLYMVLGIFIGLIFGQKATILQPLGDLFIRLLMMAAIPLVFFNLLAGLSSLTDLRIVGRIGVKIMSYYLLTTAFAVSIGIVMMNIVKPGVGITLTGKVSQEIGSVPKVTDIVLDLVPKNIFASFSSGNVAQIVVFAVFIGIVTLLLPAEQKGPLQKGFTIIADLLRKLVGIILYFGPIGIGALAAVTVGKYGPTIFGPLAKFVGAVWAAELIMVVIYMILLITIGRMSPLYFLKQSGPLYATTAATCSSLASLVVSLDVAENRLKLPKSIFTFTLPLGAQLNKDGTAIMLAGVLMFTAQAAGVEFSLASQLSIVLVGLILSEGSGGIPGGGLVIAMIFVQAFNLPLEIAAIVAGIYRLIDMANTSLNCMGDLVGTILVSRTEKEFKDTF
ncbi:MAG: hypothetical protein VR72_12555 [Clostridiaceae bacterium BRH_c20a]|nr:MAG: hypothetical protein VR72_12555 [Clostridiaceae bacterium BRH_c20a]